MKIKQIWHPYNLWEDYKYGFYETISGSKKQELISKVVHLFSDSELTEKYMQKVIDEWVYSCEQNLTNQSMNRIAYLGQAACCLYAKVPSMITMNGWNYVDVDNRNKADNIAKILILRWEQKKKLENILQNGRKKATQTGYQMKLLYP